MAPRPLLLTLLLLGCASAPPRPPAAAAPTPGPETAWPEVPRARPEAGNMLFNPSFEQDWHRREFGQQRRFLLLQASDIGVGEQDGLPDHWTLGGAGAWSQERPRSGQRVVKFTAPGSAGQKLRWLGENGWQVGGAHYGGFLPLPAELASQVRHRPITISAWCRSEGASAAPLLKVDQLLQDRPGQAASPLNAATHQETSVAFEAGSHDWQYRELVVTPKGPLHYLGVVLEARGGTVWFDDVQVKEAPAADEVNLVPNGGFEVVPGGWSPPQLWGWFRNEYYTFTGWSHEHKRDWRGTVAHDPLIHWQGRSALRFQVYPGDNFSVAGPTVALKQQRAHPLELRAMVRADQLRTLELMAQDEKGEWLPQGDFLGDDMEDDPSVYNMGTSGSGSYDWVCLRKFLAPRRPVQSLKIFLCARGFDGQRVPRSTIGTVWWDEVQLYQHGGAPPAPPTRAPGKLAVGLAQRLRVDFGERLIGENVVSVEGLEKAMSWRLNGKADGLYVGRAGETCRLRLSVGEFSSDYVFAMPERALECEVDRYFAYPGEVIQAMVRVHTSSRQPQLPELLVNGQPLALQRPQEPPGGFDATRLSVATLRSGKIHPWSEPVRDLSLVARLGKFPACQPVAVGFLEKIPPPQFPERIRSTRVDERAYLRLNDRPYFPVYWTPNFDHPFEGNYPPRLWGYPSVDANLASPQQRDQPRLFAYEMGEGEMQLQGAGWLLQLQELKKLAQRVREVDPDHVINGPETWLVGHPGHAQAMKVLMPIFDVIGVETSFEEVPEPVQPGSHRCAVLAGLEAYYYQPVESLRWRGYRAIRAGCAGVGLCPSEMLKARPAHVNYLRGLNAEFRGLAEVFTAPTPAPGSGVRVSGGALSFERQLGQRRFLFVMSPVGGGPVPLKVRVEGVRVGQVRVRGEGRSLEVRQGAFEDVLGGPYAVHVYEF